MNILWHGDLAPSPVWNHMIYFANDFDVIVKLLHIL